MKSPQTMPRTVKALAAVLVAVLLLPALVPWWPGRLGTALDHNWLAVLAEAWRHDWQYGRDIVFSFGPWGFLYAYMFHPDTFAPALLAMCGLTLAVAGGLWLSLSRLNPILWPPLVALFVAGGLAYHAFLVAGFPLDPFYFGLAFLTVAAVIRAQGTAERLVTLALFAALGWAGLIKVSLLFAGFGVVGLTVALAIAKRDRWAGLAALAWALAVGLGWLAAGQSPSGFARFIAASWEFSGGYGTAMQLDWAGPELAAFVAVGLAIAALAIHALGPQRRAEALFLAAAMAGLLLLVAKASFVRYDAHALIAWGTLATAAVALIAPLLAEPGRQRHLAGVLLVVVALSLGWSIDKHWARGLGHFAQAAFGTGYQVRARAAWRALTDHEQLVGDLTGLRDADKRLIRQRLPLPPDLSQPTDVIGNGQAAIIAADGNYRPRPMIQSHAVVRRSTALRDVRFFEGPDAPYRVIVQADPIDGRLPAFEDGALWPLLLARYDAVGLTAGGAELIRRSQPRASQLTATQSRTLPPGETLAIPPGGLQWMTMAPETTPWAWVYRLFYRCERLWLRVDVGAAEALRFRLVPGAAEAGFLISPLIETAGAFAALAALGDQAAAALSQTKPVRAVWLEKEPVEACYSGAATVTLGNLSIAGTPETPAARQFSTWAAGQLGR